MSKISIMKRIKVKTVLFTSKTYSDGTHPIFIRITHNRQTAYCSVGHSIPKDAWDRDHLKVYEVRPKVTNIGARNLDKMEEGNSQGKILILGNAKRINADIDDLEIDIRNTIKKMQAN